VTGGATGLGRAIVRRFLAEGASVAVLQRTEERAAALRKETAGSPVVVTTGDARSLEDNERAVADAVKAFGGLDCFVGNAGIYDGRLALGDYPRDKLSASFDELFATNVRGYLLGTYAALPHLRRSRGTVVFSASVSSVAAGWGGVLYVAAKHAIVGLTKQLAFELAPEVRVNAVAAGYVATRLRGLATLEQGESKAGRTEDPAARLPLRTTPTADDYADLYVMLASQASRATLTGSVLLADGGASLWGPTRPAETTHGPRGEWPDV